MRWGDCFVALRAPRNDAVSIDPGPARSPRERDVLRLHELQQPFVRALTAEPALLGAAERCRQIRHKATVEPDHAEIELLGHTHAARKILNVEIGDEAV